VRALARELVRDVHRADDVAQEACVAALRRGPDEPRAIGAWLVAVVRRLAALSRRETARRARREQLAARPEAEPATVDVVARLALHRRVVDAVESLDEPCRTALLLRYYDGLPPRAIAARLSVPVKTVQSRLDRGLEKLRARLVGEFCDERGGWTSALAPLVWMGVTSVNVKTKLTLVAASVLLLGSVGVIALRSHRHDSAKRTDGRTAAATTVASDAPSPGAIEVARTPEPPPAAEPTTSPAPGLVLRGRVVDSEARPVVGAVVELRRRTRCDLSALDGTAYWADALEATASSDASGRFSFNVRPGRRYDLLATAARNLRGRACSHYAGEEVAVELSGCATLRGRVVAKPELSPVADACVTIQFDNARAPPVELLTDGDGRFLAANLLPGSCLLDVQSQRGTTAERDFGFVLASGDDVVEEVVLGDGALLRGQVTDATTGAPIAGAEISFGLSSRLVVRTDQDGQYRWPGFRMSGMQPLYVRARGWGRAERWLSNLHEGESVQDFSLLPGRRVRGRVIDRRGDPIAEVRVDAVASAHAVGGQKVDLVTTRSGGDGSFELAELRRDLRHFLTVQSEGFATSCYAFPESELDRDELSFGDVTLVAGGSIDGRVVTDDGDPPGELFVRVVGLNDDWALWLAVPSNELPDPLRFYVAEREARLDTNGAFHFVDLPAGRFEVTTRLLHSQVEVGVPITLREGEHRGGLEIRLPRSNGLTIEGVVVDERGVPMNRVIVSARSDAPLAGRGRSDMVGADGRFRFEQLRPGTYTIVAEPLDRPLADKNGPVFVATTRAGITAGTTDLRIEMTEGARLRLMVVEADGSTAENVQLRVLIGDHEEPWTTLHLAAGLASVAVPRETPVTLEIRRPLPDANGRLAAPPVTRTPDAVLRDVVAEDGELTIELPAARAGGS